MENFQWIAWLVVLIQSVEDSFLDFHLRVLLGLIFFAQTLRQEDFHFCFPPVRKAVDAIKHLALFKVAGILVIPVWPRSQIFNYFFPDGAHTPDWVLSLEFLNPSFSPGQSVGPCFKGVQSFKTVALEFNFQNNFLSFAPKVGLDFCLKNGVWIVCN